MIGFGVVACGMNRNRDWMSGREFGEVVVW